jgi:iron complex outermembrane recepter protein
VKITHKLRSLIISSSSMAIAISLPAAALAQASPSAASESGNAGTDNLEIIVTAQRRAESLERTPISVAVLSADKLAKQVITTEADLQAFVPGLTVRATANSNNLNYSIRGQSLDAFSASPPGVLPYVNEVQVASNGASNFYDLQSVQVLKGPQGTLFGRNSTGGAVLFTTTKPSDDFGGYVTLRGGDYDLRHADGAINIPLVEDRLLVRLAGVYEHRDGYQRNLFDGRRLGNVRRYGFRGSLTMKFTDNLQNDLVVDYAHAGGDSLGLVLYSINRKGVIPASALISPANPLFAAYLAQHPGADPAGFVAFLPKQNARGPFRVSLDGSNEHEANNVVTSNITTWDISADTKVKNVFGYNRLRALDFVDTDGTPFGIVDNGTGGQINHTQQLSEELQLLGKAAGGKLSYVGGFYFADEKAYRKNTTKSLTLSPIINPPASVKEAETKNRIYAVYAQGTYDLGDWVRGLGFTAGARYSIEKTYVDYLPADLNFSKPDTPTFQKSQETTSKKVSWQLGLQEQVNRDVLLYIVARRGFRAGGFNYLSPPVVGLGSVGGNRYLPETAQDVEIGTKYAGDIGGIPTRLNFAAYRMNVKNVQRVTYALIGTATTGLTVNVPKARIQGIEADSLFIPASWLRLGGALAYTDAKFTSNQAAVLGQQFFFGPYPDTAKWSGTIFADITLPLRQDLNIVLHGDGYAQSGFFFSSTAATVNPGTFIHGYSVANFRLALENDRAGWSISANLKNAFDRVYYVGGLAIGNLASTNAVVPGGPRTISIDLRYKF